MSKTEREHLRAAGCLNGVAAMAEFAGELEALLREAQGMLVHNRCADDDATQCHGCSLEARIQEALR